MSQSSWLVGGILPGIERQPRKKLEPSPERLLAVLHRWRDEAVKAGRNITRIALAFEAGRDGFWLARWLAARGVEAHVIHPSSVAVSRERRRERAVALRNFGALIEEVRFARDSLLEGDGFELPVPRAMQARFKAKIAGFGKRSTAWRRAFGLMFSLSPTARDRSGHLEREHGPGRR